MVKYDTIEYRTFQSSKKEIPLAVTCDECGKDIPQDVEFFETKSSWCESDFAFAEWYQICSRECVQQHMWKHFDGWDEWLGVSYDIVNRLWNEKSKFKDSSDLWDGPNV